MPTLEELKIKRKIAELKGDVALYIILDKQIKEYKEFDYTSLYNKALREFNQIISKKRE